MTCRQVPLCTGFLFADLFSERQKVRAFIRKPGFHFIREDSLQEWGNCGRERARTLRKGKIMAKKPDLGERVRSRLERSYTLQKEELGTDARLSKKGMTFETESYEIPDLGHFCILRMNAFSGLMKMETAILAVDGRDVPLLNLDWVRAFGKETQIAELYDTQLTPYPETSLAEFDAIRLRDADLPDMPSKEHWYDAILYPCSYHKAGRGLTVRLAAAADAYIETFLRQLETMPACDRGVKREKTGAFARRLFAEGGPAVDQVTKLFGQDTAGRLILDHMYGVKDRR